MSKTRKKCLGSDSAKIVIDQAKREVPNFIEHDEKFEQKIVIREYSSSILSASV
tara:strand:+ start:267 stop:428 length:162 start_codon:yes stop_codon:yes gene_type:complete